MITVRYPTGVAVTYNTAHYVDRGVNEWRLLTSEN